MPELVHPAAALELITVLRFRRAPCRASRRSCSPTHQIHPAVLPIVEMASSPTHQIPLSRVCSAPWWLPKTRTPLLNLHPISYEQTSRVRWQGAVPSFEALLLAGIRLPPELERPPTLRAEVGINNGLALPQGAVQSFEALLLADPSDATARDALAYAREDLSDNLA